MEIKEFLLPELIEIDLEVLNKDEIIQHMCAVLFNKGYIEDYQGFLSDVYLRESEGDTAIGMGVAIPHGKSSHTGKTTISVAKLLNPIKWSDSSDEMVDFVILFSVREVDNTSVHLQLLAKIASKLGHDEILYKLKSSKSTDDIIDILSAKE